MMNAISVISKLHKSPKPNETVSRKGTNKNRLDSSNHNRRTSKRVPSLRSLNLGSNHSRKSYTNELDSETDDEVSGFESEMECLVEKLQPEEDYNNTNGHHPANSRGDGNVGSRTKQTEKTRIPEKLRKQHGDNPAKSLVLVSNVAAAKVKLKEAKKAFLLARREMEEAEQKNALRRRPLERTNSDSQLEELENLHTHTNDTATDVERLTRCIKPRQRPIVQRTHSEGKIDTSRNIKPTSVLEFIGVGAGKKPSLLKKSQGLGRTKSPRISKRCCSAGHRSDASRRQETQAPSSGSSRRRHNSEGRCKPPGKRSLDTRPSNGPGLKQGNSIRKTKAAGYDGGEGSQRSASVPRSERPSPMSGQHDDIYKRFIDNELPLDPIFAVSSNDDTGKESDEDKFSNQFHRRPSNQRKTAHYDSINGRSGKGTIRKRGGTGPPVSTTKQSALRPSSGQHNFCRKGPNQEVSRSSPTSKTTCPKDSCSNKLNKESTTSAVERKEDNEDRHCSTKSAKPRRKNFQRKSTLNIREVKESNSAEPFLQLNLFAAA